MSLRNQGDRPSPSRLKAIGELLDAKPVPAEGRWIYDQGWRRIADIEAERRNRPIPLVNGAGAVDARGSPLPPEETPMYLSNDQRRRVQDDLCLLLAAENLATVESVVLALLGEVFDMSPDDARGRASRASKEADNADRPEPFEPEPETE